jgi:hypothetical protein
MIGIGSIFFESIEKCYARNSKLELMKLLEKWTRKIKILSIIKRVPCSTPPVILVINNIRLIWRVYRDDFLARCSTSILIEFTFISPRESSLPSAVRAESWRRDEIFSRGSL